MRGRAGPAALALLGGLAFACGPASDEGSAAAPAPVALADQEDAVCGMLVREQSAPRGQVLHRDGTRLFFCSVGDLLVHVTAPSPHGEVVGVFVEAMKPEEEPLQSHPELHPWVAAEDAVFVVGVERRSIMGKPVLVYGDMEAAAEVASRHTAARTLDFEGLKAWWSQAIEGG